MSEARAGIHHALLDGVIGRRMFGWFIDILILGLGTAALTLVVFLLGLVTFGLSWWLFGGFWVLPILYAWLFVASPAQATPGQALAGLRVVNDDTLGPPTPAEALVWSILYALTATLSGGVLLLLVFFTEHKRALHDLLSGLTVVRADGWRALGGPAAP
jgi:uncharacterized RDD family membrane protein YckC